MFCVYTRSRFQVSVNRTIGPPVCILGHTENMAATLFAIEVKTFGRNIYGLEK